MDEENKKIIKMLEKNHLQGLIKFPNGDIMMLSKTEGERLEILECAKTELLYNEKMITDKVNKMMQYENGTTRMLNKTTGGINYVG